MSPVAQLEKQFTHPVAKAIVRLRSQTHLHIDTLNRDEASPSQKIFIASREWIIESNQHAGLGVSGAVGIFDVDVGNRELMVALGNNISRQHDRIADQIVARSNAPCWIAVDGRVVGIAELTDAIRQDASQAVAELKRQGWQVGILSGDNQQIVDRVAMRLGIDLRDAKGQVTPEEKLACIQSETITPVVMVGDGVNDSAALAAADVGIAVKSGAEASLAAAPVYLAKPGLRPILTLLATSRSTDRTMRRNLIVSLAYNVTFAALAFCGYINPLVAAILMPLSSLTVVGLSMTAGMPGRFTGRTNQ